MDKPILRALSVPELLDRVLQIYRKHALLLMGVGAVIYIPEAIIRSFVALYMQDTRFIDIVQGYLLSPFVQLAMIVAISSLYLGEEVTISSAYGTGSRKYWSMFGAALLFGLGISAPLFLLLILSMGGELFILVGLLIWIPFVVFLSTRWSIYLSAIMLEDMGPGEGLKRSWSLTEGHFWRVFWTSFAAWLLSLLFSGLPVIFANYIFSQLLNVSSVISVLVTTIFQQLVSIIALPFTIGVNVLIFYDLRIRKEGFDLLFMADSSVEN